MRVKPSTQRPVESKPAARQAVDPRKYRTRENVRAVEARNRREPQLAEEAPAVVDDITNPITSNAADPGAGEPGAFGGYDSTPVGGGGAFGQARPKPSGDPRIDAGKPASPTATPRNAAHPGDDGARSGVKRKTEQNPSV